MPVGRVITRCTQDISTIDGPLSNLGSALMQLNVFLISALVTTVAMTGWPALFAGLIMAFLGGMLGHIYLKGQLSIRREMSNAKSPVMSQVGAVLAGLRKLSLVHGRVDISDALLSSASIRAYGAHAMFRAGLRKRQDHYARAALTFYDINRWVAVRMDTLGGLFSASIAAYLVYSSDVGAGGVGFTLNLVIAFASNILWWVRIYNLVEIQGMVLFFVVRTDY